MLLYIGLLLMRRTDDDFDSVAAIEMDAIDHEQVLTIGEDVILFFFFCELLLRLAGLGFALFFRHQENFLDFIIFGCTVAGTVAINQTAADKTLQDDALYSFLRLLRVSQVLRILYKVQSIYRM